MDLQGDLSRHVLLRIRCNSGTLAARLSNRQSPAAKRRPIEAETQGEINMATKALFLVIAVSATLFGCSPAPMRSMDHTPCNEGTCFIDVSVNDCKIAVDPTERHIARPNKEAVIHWSMDMASYMAYRFAENGIAFERNPDNEFHDRGHSHFGKHFVWTDKNSLPGNYKYTVNVVRRFSGEPCPPLDPSVFND
ncbi:MAG: hypothetical protein ABJC33_00755 [Betaproteobacteria bacterium]